MHLPPVGNTNDQHDELAVLHFVQHAVITDAKPSQAPQLPFQCAAQERVLRQSVDGFDKARTVRFRDSFQFLGRTSLNPY